MEINPEQLQEQIKMLLQYKKIVDMSNSVSKAGIDGKITYVNEEFCRVSGYSADELIGKNHNVVRHPDMLDQVFENLWETILSKKMWKGTIKNHTKNGETYVVHTTIVPILNNREEISEFISIRHDITDLVKLRDKFQYLSITDCLTGIYNRGFFQETLQSELRKKSLDESTSSLILFDIDHFKEINDNYGHDIGDKVLIKFTEKVKQVIRKKDLFCRIGGDEFAILFSDTEVHEAKLISEKIRKAIETVMFAENKILSASFGITEFSNGDSLEMIYKRADIALYQAKEKGRNCIVINKEMG